MVPKASRILMLDKFAGYAGRNDLRVKLVKTDPAPADADIVLGDLDECTFDGYIFQSPVWGAGALDGSFVAAMETGILEWTAGGGLAGPQTIYGMYITMTNPLDGVTQYLLDWSRLAASVTLALPGQKFRRVYKIQGTNYVP